MRSVLLSVAGLLACTPSVPAGPLSQQAAADPAPEIVEAEAQPAKASAPAEFSYTPGQIGWGAIPYPSRAARKHNRKALAAHRKGDYLASKAGFERALATSSTHDMARFNLACAHSRLGELEDAKRELVTLLERDLLRFQGRWRGEEADADLEALRGSEYAEEIDEAVAALRITYDEVQDEGIPAYVYGRVELVVPKTEAAGGADPDDAPTTGGTSALVAGVYLPAVRRFVPLTRGESLALLDLPTRRVVHVRNSYTDGWYEPTIDDPTLLLRSTSPDPGKQFETKLKMTSKKLRVNTHGLESNLGFVHGLVLAWAPERLVFELWHVDPSEGSRKRTGFIEHDGTHGFEALELEGYPRLEMLMEGAVQHAPTAPRPKRTKRPRKAQYESVIPGPEGNFAVVVRQRHETDADYSHNDATVDRVDLSTGDATRLSRGSGAGWALFDADGALYVETGGATRRWAAVDADASERVLSGVHIAMPRDDQICNLCG